MIKNKLRVQHLLAYADLFIGGGGTLNSEACFFGTPTISTRSFISHYDKWLIDLGLMAKADSANELVDIALASIAKRNEKARAIFTQMPFNLDEIIEQILYNRIH